MVSRTEFSAQGGISSSEVETDIQLRMRPCARHTQPNVLFFANELRQQTLDGSKLRIWADLTVDNITEDFIQNELSVDDPKLPADWTILTPDDIFETKIIELGPNVEYIHHGALRRSLLPFKPAILLLYSWQFLATRISLREEQGDLFISLEIDLYS